MPNYKYKAINHEGKVVESVILATSPKVVVQQLQKLNMTAVSIKKHREKSRKKKISVKVPVKTLLMFTKQLHTLLRAGIPIITCLTVIQEQTEEIGFKKLLGAVMADVGEGSKLSVALGQFPKVFPPLYINSIRVGEVSGTLEDALAQLSSFMEEDDRIKKEVKKALRYPTIVVIALIGAFFLFVTLIVPNFIPIFKMSGNELPLPTRILLGVYTVLTSYGWLVALIAVGAVLAIGMYIKTPQGKYRLDLIKLKLPVMGALVRKLNISRFAKLLHTMNSTGISIIKSFEIIKDTLDNEVYKDEVGKIQERITKGEAIAASLKQSPYFDNLLVIMTSIGEKSGALDDMLGNVSEYYYREVSDTVDKLTSLIEPMVTVVLGAMMLFLALAIFLPMWDMMSIM